MLMPAPEELRLIDEDQPLDLVPLPGSVALGPEEAHGLKDGDGAGTRGGDVYVRRIMLPLVGASAVTTAPLESSSQFLKRDAGAFAVQVIRLGHRGQIYRMR
jgi:hypothetical protein